MNEQRIREIVREEIAKVLETAAVTRRIMREATGLSSEDEPFEIPTDTEKYDIWVTEHGTRWQLKKDKE